MSYLIPLLGGVLYPFGFPMKSFPGFFAISILGFFLYVFSLERNLEQNLGLKKAILGLLCYSLGYALVGYYWIPFTLNEFGNIPFPINILLGALFSLIIVPQLLFFVILLNYLNKKPTIKSLVASYPKSRAILLAFTLVVFENYIPQQFPGHLGHSWLRLAPYLGLSTTFGVGIFSFMSYWLIWDSLRWFKYKKTNWVLLGSFSLFLIGILTTPLQLPKSEPSHLLKTRFVQANVGNFLKLDSERGGATSMKEIYQRYFDLSLKPSDSIESNFDLIIWPETAYPQLLNSSMMRVSPAFIPSIARKAIQKTNSYIFFGGYDKSGEENKNFYETEYNSAFLITPENQLGDVYHKRLLIPFGESLPFGPLNPLLAGLIKNMAFFAKGQRFTQFQLEKGTRFISAICYEILFSGFIRDYLNSQKEQPHFIINLTNDSWYGDTAEPYQHQHLAFWRAIEFQIPILRMTNTGITSVLFPNGSESKRLPIFKQGVLDLELEIHDRKPTIFQSWGLLPLFLLCLLIFSICFLLEKKKSKALP
ncbi:MAG: apolipoprotein N-acyltransferase [Halobacteriovoraceae bacterium]|nr:apolipoprotein N-acyltransferase [Halobacteriovoraceae bacterium]